MAGVTLMNKLRNCMMRVLCNVESDVVTKLENGMRRLGHVEKIKERRLTKQIVKGE